MAQPVTNGAQGVDRAALAVTLVGRPPVTPDGASALLKAQDRRGAPA